MITPTYFWKYRRGGVENRTPLPLLNTEHLKNIHRTLMESKFFMKYREDRNMEDDRYIGDDIYSDRDEEWIDLWLSRIVSEMSKRGITGHDIELSRTDIVKRYNKRSDNYYKYRNRMNKLDRDLGYK